MTHTVETAQRAFAACTDETQRFVSSYVDGVNEAIAGLDPETVPAYFPPTSMHAAHAPGMTRSLQKLAIPMKNMVMMAASIPLPMPVPCICTKM